MSDEETLEISYEDSLAYATDAMVQMQAREISPTPHSFAVWYHYATANNEELKQEIDRAISREIEFNQNMNDYLYHKYIEPTEAAAAEKAEQEADETQEKTKKMLANILKVVGDIAGNSGDYQQQVDGHIKELESYKEGDDVGAMVQKIIQSTTALKESSSKLSSRLEETKNEAQTLRQDLEEKTHEAQHDFLTNIFNRKALDTKIEESMVAASSEGHPLCFVMIDVDHFKAFNDTHGHLIGDEVLKMVANILKSSLKGKDIVARFGGEEFAVLLPETPIDGAMIVADMLRQGIARKSLRRRDTGEVIGKVTVSMGVSIYDSETDNLSSLVQRADEALYQAKETGRNRVMKQA